MQFVILNFVCTRNVSGQHCWRACTALHCLQMLNFLMAMMSGHGGFSSDMEPNLQITFQPSAAPTSTSPTATSVGGASVPTTANPLIEEAGSADAPTTPTVASSAAAATCSSGVGSSSTRQIYSFPSELLELVADLQEPEFRPVCC